MKILITSGPTREPIDSVRFITNLSTGETGKVLAEFFEKQGHQITFLRGGDSRYPIQGCRVLSFETFQDLHETLQRILVEEEFDVVIHAAAVGDYSVSQIKVGDKTLSDGTDVKIDSQEQLEVILKRNFKILERIKNYTVDKKPLVVGFKFTHTQQKEEWWKAVQKIYSSGSVDLVVHNDFSERHGEAGARFRIFDRAGVFTECDSRLELAKKLATAVNDCKREIIKGEITKGGIQ